VTLRFSPNLSLLWSGLPLAERFERAAAAGFGAVELWWPGARQAALLPELTRQHGLRLAALNFDAGDMPAGERGLTADPARRDQFRANVPDALRIARSCGCTRLNALVGLRQERYPLEVQLECALENVRWAADQAAAVGATVLIEAVNSKENGPYLLTTTGAAADFIKRAGRENIRLLYDAYHLQRMEGDLSTAMDACWPLIGHIQIADVPGRGEPGTGEINYRFLLDHLEQRGYDGYVGLEYRPSGGGSPEGSFGWLEEFGRPRSRPADQARRSGVES
jgi:hydroxypyruvate isomerase